MGKGIHSVTVIKVSEPNRTYFLDENRKTYWVYDYKPGEGGGEDGTTAKRIGKDRVAGFACEKVVLTSASGRESELCVAPDFIAGDSWLRAFQAREQGKGADRGIWKALLDAGVKGFPVRWSTKGGKDGRGAFQMELVSAKKQSVPASMFRHPGRLQEAGDGHAFLEPRGRAEDGRGDEEHDPRAAQADGGDDEEDGGREELTALRAAVEGGRVRGAPFGPRPRRR